MDSKEYWAHAGQEVVKRYWKSKKIDLKVANEKIKSAKINLKLLRKCMEWDDIQDIDHSYKEKMRNYIIGIENYIVAAEEYKRELKNEVSKK